MFHPCLFESRLLSSDGRKPELWGLGQEMSIAEGLRLERTSGGLCSNPKAGLTLKLAQLARDQPF